MPSPFTTFTEHFFTLPKETEETSANNTLLLKLYREHLDRSEAEYDRKVTAATPVQPLYLSKTSSHQEKNAVIAQMIALLEGLKSISQQLFPDDAEYDVMWDRLVEYVSNQGSSRDNQIVLLSDTKKSLENVYLGLVSENLPESTKKITLRNLRNQNHDHQGICVPGQLNNISLASSSINGSWQGLFHDWRRTVIANCAQTVVAKNGYSVETHYTAWLCNSVRYDYKIKPFPENGMACSNEELQDFLTLIEQNLSINSLLDHLTGEVILRLEDCVGSANLNKFSEFMAQLAPNNEDDLNWLERLAEIKYSVSADDDIDETTEIRITQVNCKPTQIRFEILQRLLKTHYLHVPNIVLRIPLKRSETENNPSNSLTRSTLPQPISSSNNHVSPVTIGKTTRSTFHELIILNNHPDSAFVIDYLETESEIYRNSQKSTNSPSNDNPSTHTVTITRSHQQQVDSLTDYFEKLDETQQINVFTTLSKALEKNSYFYFLISLHPYLKPSIKPQSLRCFIENPVNFAYFIELIFDAMNNNINLGKIQLDIEVDYDKTIKQLPDLEKNKIVDILYQLGCLDSSNQYLRKIILPEELRYTEQVSVLFCNNKGVNLGKILIKTGSGPLCFLQDYLKQRAAATYQSTPARENYEFDQKHSSEKAEVTNHQTLENFAKNTFFTPCSHLGLTQRECDRRLLIHIANEIIYPEFLNAKQNSQEKNTLQANYIITLCYGVLGGLFSVNKLFESLKDNRLNHVKSYATRFLIKHKHRDFRNLNLAQLDLSYVDFSNCDFSNTVFKNIKLDYAKFSNAKLTGCQFNDMLLYSVNFSHAILESVQFNKCLISSSIFNHSKKITSVTLNKTTVKCDNLLKTSYQDNFDTIQKSLFSHTPYKYLADLIKPSTTEYLAGRIFLGDNFITSQFNGLIVTITRAEINTTHAQCLQLLYFQFSGDPQIDPILDGLAKLLGTSSQPLEIDVMKEFIERVHHQNPAWLDNPNHASSLEAILKFYLSAKEEMSYEDLDNPGLVAGMMGSWRTKKENILTLTH
ncbi:MAG: pentapeptide repeat-containing protein [Legionellales bacterium]|nr:pentapeptide repeat-containing protein [Legionellales bacterium]